MKFKICIAAMLLLLLQGRLQAQTSIKALSVGDAVPDIKLTNIMNYKSATAKLSDFKNKLVIIDFWGKYCSSCITALGKLNLLQQEYKDRLQVITVSDFTNKRDLLAALSKYAVTKNFNLVSLTQNDLLLQYFPHVLVSHIVWIDGNRIIKAITGSEYITDNNIQQILDGKPVNWPLKKDVFEFDYKKPLLQLASSAISTSGLYYSAFTSYIDGISPPSGTFADSTDHISITAFYNYDLLSLVQLALNFSSGASREQFVLHVKDTTRYIKGDDEYYDAWSKKNTYCYFLQLPLGLNEKETEKIVQQDVLRWLNIKGIYAEIKQPADETQQAVYIITEKEFIQ